MPSSASAQHQTNWPPTNQAAAKASPVLGRPFVTVQPKQVESLTEDKAPPQRPDLMQIMRASAPPAPPSPDVQQKEAPELDETEDKVQRKCADCASGDDDGEDNNGKPSIQTKLTNGGAAGRSLRAGGRPGCGKGGIDAESGGAAVPAEQRHVG